MKTFKKNLRAKSHKHLGRIYPGKMGKGNPYQRVQGNKTEEFGQQSRRPQLLFPNFPPKDDGQGSHTLQFRLRDCAHSITDAVILEISLVIAFSYFRFNEGLVFSSNFFLGFLLLKPEIGKCNH